MDCICCGFGAILLLFILTAKRQANFYTGETAQRIEAARTLRAAIAEEEIRIRELEAALASAGENLRPEGPDRAELVARKTELSVTLKELKDEVAALQSVSESAEGPAAPERPSADREYLSGLRLAGPRILILLESSGSMVAEDATEALDILRAGQGRDAPKWKRAKAAVRSVLAAMPKGNQAAVYAFAESTSALSGDTGNPWLDPYENSALLSLLARLEAHEAAGGADLARALNDVAKLNPKPDSILLITDGLPTAPASKGSLTESRRVELLRRAMALQPNLPFNVLLIPFDGDPAAAGLYWQMTGRTSGVTIVPNAEWPPLN